MVKMRGVVRARFEPRRHTHIMGHSSSSVCCLSNNYIRHLNCSKWLTYQGFASTDDSLHIGAADTFFTVLRELQNCSGFKTEMGWARPVTPLVYTTFTQASSLHRQNLLTIQFSSSMMSRCLLFVCFHVWTWNRLIENHSQRNWKWQLITNIIWLH